MAGISDSDKLGMAALIASIGDEQKVNRAKKADRVIPNKTAPVKRKKITLDDVKSGKVSIGDANDEAAFSSYKNGGMIDRAAIKGKTRGKIC